jgi:hypothetical protein
MPYLVYIIYLIRSSIMWDCVTYHAPGGQGDSFRENRPVKHLDPCKSF